MKNKNKTIQRPFKSASKYGIKAMIDGQNISLVDTARVKVNDNADAIKGRVKWMAKKSIWTTFMTLVGLIGAPLTFSWSTLSIFLVLTCITICAGHSVGMHRLLIHKSFDCPKWIEYVLVYLGTLVGMAGPMGMIKTHDIRDWSQRQRNCHDLHAHNNKFLKDAFWQMHCDLEFDHPPEIKIEDEIANDKFYQFLEKTWMQQQIPLAVLLFLIGGIPWVIWGICLRITISLTGHWLIGHYAHRKGQISWFKSGRAVQGYNVPIGKWLTFGECWHNNHHAFPGSAKLGLKKGEIDFGWYFILILKKLNVAWNIKTPKDSLCAVN